MNAQVDEGNAVLAWKQEPTQLMTRMGKGASPLEDGTGVGAPVEAYVGARALGVDTGVPVHDAAALVHNEETGVPIRDDATGVPVHDEETGVEVHNDAIGVLVHVDATGVEVHDDATGVEVHDDATGVEVRVEEHVVIGVQVPEVETEKVVHDGGEMAAHVMSAKQVRERDGKTVRLETQLQRMRRRGARAGLGLPLQREIRSCTARKA